METKKLFYEDAYIKKFEATIVDEKPSNDGTLLAFSQTAFYPEGGGQQADKGYIVVDETKYEVTDAHEKEGIIWHTISTAANGMIGKNVQGFIDWENRFDHMQQHSGEHIVSGMICEKFNCDNVGFHLGKDVVTIDYNVPISLEDALEIENAANKYIWENHKFIELWPTSEELKELNYRSKKELSGAVRIASFPGADMCACCGTHVKTSGEIGLVKFISAHSFREGTRLELLCGNRALKFLSKVYTQNKEISVLLSAKDFETSGATSKLLEDNIQLKSKKDFVEDQYIELFVETYRGKNDALVISDWMSPDMGRRLADKLADVCPGVCAVLCKGADIYEDESIFRYSLVSRNKDLSELVKEMNTNLNGKGGGRGGFAQGTLSATKEQIENYFQNNTV